jgi:hypothetical protein
VAPVAIELASNGIRADLDRSDFHESSALTLAGLKCVHSVMKSRINITAPSIVLNAVI